MVAGGEQSGYGMLSVQEQLWMFSQFYGLASRGQAPGRGAHRGGQPPGPAPPAGRHAVDRPAPEDELRARPPQRPVDLLPRRADPGPGRLGRPGGPRAHPRVAGRRPGPDRPADDPLHGRGRRDVRADRDRRPRQDPRDRQPGRAQAARPDRVDHPPRARPARWRPRRPRPPARRRQRRGRDRDRAGGWRGRPDRGDQPGPRRTGGARRCRRRAGRPRAADRVAAHRRAEPRGRLHRARRPRVRRCRQRRRPDPDGRATTTPPARRRRRPAPQNAPRGASEPEPEEVAS